jgi:hypothetical protein
MLYVAFFKNKSNVLVTGAEVLDKSRKWWDQGGKPKGFKTVAIFSCLGTNTTDVFVFEAESHDEIREMVNFWRDTTDFEIHPAVDLMALFRQQGMNVT